MSTHNPCYTIHPISAAEHREFAQQYQPSFLQLPEWAAVKPQWRAESLGWFDAQGGLAAAALVLYRGLPVVKKTLAYIPEGPVGPWRPEDVPALLGPLRDYMKQAGAFLLRVGPPVVRGVWGAEQVRKALSADTGGTIAQLPIAGTQPASAATGDGAAPNDEVAGWPYTEQTRAASAYEQAMAEAGFTPVETGEDFAAGQPEYQARIPLVNAAGESYSVDEVLARMDQSSRRQTRKSTRTGVAVIRGGEEDFTAWSILQKETAERDGFQGRPESYFRTMFRELNAINPESCVLYLARAEADNAENAPEGTLLAAAIFVRQGPRSWYLYGASSNDYRKLYAPRRLQLAMIEDSLAAGCESYDLGGISATLTKDHPLAGLTRFKTTMGADVVRTLGEWDLTLNKALAAAFRWYMKRRSIS